MNKHQTYLGDAVYAQYDGNDIVLTTEHHEIAKAGNVIYLEPEILEALIKYAERLKGEIK